MTAMCPSFGQLAAAASGEEDTVAAHLETCAACQAAFDEQHMMRVLVQQAPAIVIGKLRRTALAAEVLARTDLMVEPEHEVVAPSAAPPRVRRRWMPLAGALLVAGAAVLVLITGKEGARVSERTAAVTARESVVLPTPTPTVVPIIEPDASPVESDPGRSDREVVVRRLRAASLAGAADYSQESRRDREVVRLANGELTVDAIDARPVLVVNGNISVAVRRAKVEIVARKGVIEQVSVFAGAAEVRVGSKTIPVEAGTIWERPDPHVESLGAFRDGWTALRENRHRDAIAAFDRATDPTIAEDALYWGAIASERAGDMRGASRRYRELLEQFPSSPRGADAKAALARLDDK